MSDLIINVTNSKFYFNVVLLSCSPSPGGGTKLSRIFSGVLFQIFLMISLSSRLHWSMGPSILIFSEVRITANSVARNSTVPSALSGMFMATRRLQATRCGHSLPNPSGGEIFRSSVTTSTCLMRPCSQSQLSIVIVWTNHSSVSYLGVRVVLGPQPHELVEVVGAEDGPVAGEVVEVVHDDGHEQVEHEEGAENEEGDEVNVGEVSSTTLSGLVQSLGVISLNMEICITNCQDVRN